MQAERNQAQLTADTQAQHERTCPLAALKLQRMQQLQPPPGNDEKDSAERTVCDSPRTNTHAKHPQRLTFTKPQASTSTSSTEAPRS
jgi:hypothetical protein